MICQLLFLAMISAVGRLHRGMYSGYQDSSLFDTTVVLTPAYAILGLMRRNMNVRSVESHGTSLTVPNRKATLRTFLLFPDSARW